jgi:hypothetical protein
MKLKQSRLPKDYDSSLDLRRTVESASDHQVLLFSSLDVEYWHIELQYLVTLCVLKYPSFLCLFFRVQYVHRSLSLSLSLSLFCCISSLSVWLSVCVFVRKIFLLERI